MLTFHRNIIILKNDVAVRKRDQGMSHQQVAPRDLGFTPLPAPGAQAEWAAVRTLRLIKYAPIADNRIYTP
jgi:hypothetical protein